MTAAGRLFELQTQGRLTSESESLSSPVQVFNTLTTASNGRSPAFRGNANPNPYEFVEDSKKLGLLPTPTIGHIRNYDEEIDDYLDRRQDYLDGKVKGMPGVSLGVAVRMELLKTPLADYHKNNGHNPNRIETLARQVWVTQKETNWGRFAAAIQRWEQVTGRKSPPPTKPDGKDGSHRLSSLFTEWLMGLPEGHITGHNLSRADELKMAGNGVVPQQAELALRFLIDDDNFK
jgi:DNA (cytosine-5)-methyltransferase 1